MRKSMKSLLAVLVLATPLALTSCEGMFDDIFGEWSRPTGNNGNTKTNVDVIGVTLDHTTLTKAAGDDAVTLTATVAPDNASDKTVTWKTSDASIAAVDANGKVTFVAAGIATITATATNGTDDTADDKTATCEVTVSPLILTSPALGQVIGSDGKNYAKDASLPTGVTKAAVIVYLDGTGHGLALALQDAGQIPWADANTAATNATPKFSNATWRVPTNADWWSIFGKTGDVNTSNSITSLNLPGYILGAGGSNFLAEQYYYYWSGTEDGEDNAWTLRMDLVYENKVTAFFFNNYPKYGTLVYVRLCLAF